MGKKVAVILLVLFLISLLAGCTQVPAGHVGVFLHFNEAKATTGQGLNWYGIGSRVTAVDCRIRQFLVENAQASSKDLQVVHTSISVNYHIDPAKVKEFWDEVGYQQFRYNNDSIGYMHEINVMEPRIQEVLKSVSARFTANDLIQRREEVKEQIEAALIKRLAPFYLKVEAGGVNITNFTFSPEYDAAIEQKVVAQQNLQKAEIELQTAKINAETERVKAQSYMPWDPKLLFLSKWNGQLPTAMGGDTLMQIPGATTK